LLLLGPNHCTTRYHGDNEIINHYTPLLRAQAALPDANVTYSIGCNVEADDDDEGGFAEAIALATAADTVILFLGLVSERV
jgi:hypothetical protein